MEKDITEHTLLDYNDVFADIYNVLCGRGKTVIRPDELEPAEGRSQYKFYGNNREQERDIIKRWNGADIKMAFIGMENQTVPDPTMVFRCISYDGASYRSQIPTGKERREGAVFHPVPVVTFVLYLGCETRWNSCRSLREALTIPEDLNPYFQDYRITVMEIAWLDRAVIDSFQSDFWFLADYLWQMRVYGDYNPKNDKVIHRVSEVMSLFHAVTGNEFFTSDSAKELATEREVKMEDAFSRAEKRAAAEAAAKTEIEAIAEMVISLSGLIDMNDAISARKLDEEKESAVREEIRKRGYAC